ncbi:hypothetical protein RND71_022461 [Anisodus tanguticus]|uniref:Uncharacterized protein n=1 Tax=Anisodus tanguticus TaxID=243964 RepID=A0AAE1RS41_9SOLA|nr:hypothetical protein RND71_022461 [Anisodus tanguticus]
MNYWTEKTTCSKLQTLYAWPSPQFNDGIRIEESSYFPKLNIKRKRKQLK